MTLPSSQQGSQKAILRAGFILTLVLQLVPAQPILSVELQPPNPKWGQNVTFNLLGAPLKNNTVQCHWDRRTPTENRGPIITYTPQKSPKFTNGSASSGRETLGEDCVLHITWLTHKDTANYTVTIETAQSKEKVNPQQNTAHVFLNISEPKPVTTELKPKEPRPGQTVILSVPSRPTQFFLCEWSKEIRPGIPQIVQTYFPGQRNPQETRHTVKEDCSLSIKDLVIDDAGSYMVRIEAPLGPRKETENLECGEDCQVYLGKVTLKVLPQEAKKGKQDSGSASLSYNAGVLIATLLGSLAWADPLMTTLAMLFCPFASLRSKFLP